MLKETVTYTNFDGEVVTDVVRFNLTRAELLEMEITTKDGWTNYVNRIIKAENTAEIFRVYKDLVLKGYGIMSDDGKHFIKRPELAEEFSHSEAFSELFMKVFQDADAASRFMEQMLPPMPEGAADNIVSIAAKNS